ncbi:hypothetical protein H6P81_008048 [Aristolochia fimbriata]|uniref:SWIB complex BAF60b domain-containing protein n=1 Tax=Aristolochia fimbriata TaxID=158543 RepID=A0AAV7F2L2_ARIFI|nr:hypothetical protein H6P81_008048 [Aristolochia fimbriata]
MVSDQDIANGVASVLRQSDPNAVASVTGVVQQLEAKLGLDLSHKAAFISDQIDLLLRSQHHSKDHFALQNRQHFQSPQPPQQQQQQQPQLFHLVHPPSSSAPTPFTLQPYQHNSFSRSGPHEIDFRYPHQVLLPGDAAKIGIPVSGNVPVTQEVPKQSAQTGTKRKGGPGGLNKVCGVSPALQAIVGEPTMPRTQIVKQLWAYIRKNNLQDPNNKRKIICNDELKLVFETDCTDMFKMNKLLSKHILPLDPTKEPDSDSKRLKTTDAGTATDSTDTEASPMLMSDLLASFVGTGEKEIRQSAVEKHVWDYIKVNQLEDPLNPIVIRCDPKLQELFGCHDINIR